MESLEKYREFILAANRQFLDKDYFKVLGLPRGAHRPVLEAGIRRWEEGLSSPFREQLDEDTLARLEEVEAVLGQMRSVLLDAHLREEYVEELRSQEIGGPGLEDPSTSLIFVLRELKEMKRATIEPKPRNPESTDGGTISIMLADHLRQEGLAASELAAELGGEHTPHLEAHAPSTQRRTPAEPELFARKLYDASQTLSFLLEDVLDEAPGDFDTDEQATAELPSAEVEDTDVLEADEVQAGSGRHELAEDEPLFAEAPELEQIEGLRRASNTISFMLREILAENKSLADEIENAVADDEPAAPAAPLKPVTSGSEAPRSTSEQYRFGFSGLGQGSPPPQQKSGPIREVIGRPSPQKPPAAAPQREEIRRPAASARPKERPAVRAEKVDELYKASEEMASLLQDYMPEDQFKQVRGRLDNFKQREQERKTKPAAETSEQKKRSIDDISDLFDASSTMASLLQDVLRSAQDGADPLAPTAAKRNVPKPKPAKVPKPAPRKEQLGSERKIMDQYDASESMALLLKDVLSDADMGFAGMSLEPQRDTSDRDEERRARREARGVFTPERQPENADTDNGYEVDLVRVGIVGVAFLAAFLFVYGYYLDIVVGL